MQKQQLTPTESLCASLHSRLLAAVQLRDQLIDQLAECEVEFSRAAGLRWDRLYRVLGLAERRVERRRLRWLEAQRSVFLAIAAEARAARPDAHQSVDRLTEALERAYDAARAR
jgi:hypothetical protein